MAAEVQQWLAREANPTKWSRELGVAAHSVRHVG